MYFIDVSDVLSYFKGIMMVIFIIQCGIIIVISAGFILLGYYLKKYGANYHYL